MNDNKFNAPTIEIITFNKQDIVTTSWILNPDEGFEGWIPIP